MKISSSGSSCSCVRQVAVCLAWFLTSAISLAVTTNVLYSTAFEASEGFDGTYTLIGQAGWIGEGTGGNGLVTNFFPGWNQQAFIGYFPPEGNENSLSVYRPVPYSPTPGRSERVRFEVDMCVIDSTNGEYDDFRWSLYNNEGVNAQRLFTLNFDNSSYLISYSLDDTNGFLTTDKYFTNTLIYHLAIEMDFRTNDWSAFLDNERIVSHQPITTQGAALSMGDLDAVWVLGVAARPGDNYLLFDNYRISVESNTTVEPEAALEGVAVLPGGQFLLRLSGPPGRTYVLEYSLDLHQWSAIKTGTVGSDGWLDFLDTDASQNSRRFYRARQL
jgi:hypothetical protein